MPLLSLMVSSNNSPSCSYLSHTQYTMPSSFITCCFLSTKKPVVKFTVTDKLKFTNEDSHQSSPSRREIECLCSLMQSNSRENEDNIQASKKSIGTLIK